MKVLPDTPIKLMCTYWGSDSGRTFDILVDGRQIATQKLNKSRPEAFFDVEYDIPIELTKDKTSVIVCFDGHQESITGGAFGCATLKSEP
jgi:hypothetical protein